MGLSWLKSITLSKEMNKLALSERQENILLLLWSLPIVVLIFLIFTIKTPFSQQSYLIAKAVLFSLCFVSVINQLYRKTLVIGSSIFLGIIPFVALGFFSEIIRITFLPVFAYTIIVELKQILFSFRKEKISILIGNVVTIFLTLMPFFTLVYSQPNSMGRLLEGSLINDTLFHSSIASMWKNYSVISHGLHGLGELKYHVGSHFFITGVSIFLDISTFEAYSNIVGFFLVPLLGVTIISVAEELFPSVSNFDFLKKNFAYCFLLLGTGIFIQHGFLYRFALWPSFYESESYAFSLILLLSLYSVLKNNLNFSPFIRILLIVGIFGLTTFAKVSSGFCSLAVIGSWALFSEEKLLSKNWYYRWTIFTLCFFIFLIIFSMIHVRMEGESIQSLEFIHTYIAMNASIYVKYICFVIFHFVFFHLAFIFYLSNFKNEPMKKAFPVWWIAGLFLTFIIGLSVLTFLSIGGGSGYYFSNVSMFIALPFLLSIPQIINEKLSIFVKVVLVLVLVLIFLFNAPIILRDSVKKFLVETRSDLPVTMLTSYIEKLEEIKKDKSTLHSLIYIPRTELHFWGDGQYCRNRHHVIAAISERPAIYGWPYPSCYEFLCGQRFFSNGLCNKSLLSYSDEELLREAKRIGFEQVKVITDKEIRTLR